MTEIQYSVNKWYTMYTIYISRYLFRFVDEEWKNNDTLIT